MIVSTDPTPLAPVYDTIVAHLRYHFGGALEGRFEVCARNAVTSKIDNSLARTFDMTQFEEAAEWAVKINSVPGQNAYFTPAVLFDETPAKGRSSDADVAGTNSIWSDLDDDGAAEQARAIAGTTAMPSYAVITGRIPHTRLQMHYFADELITDHDTIRELNGGICAKMLGDPTVVNPARIMRLGGTVAWPVKEGRVAEMTEFQPRSAVQFGVQRLREIFTQSDPALQNSDTVPLASRHGGIIPGGQVPVGQRDDYMARTVMACFIELTGTHGTAPTVDELVDLAWPQFDQGTHAEPHDQKKMRHKAKYLLNRFDKKRLPKFPTLDEVDAAWAKKKADRMPAQPEAVTQATVEAAAEAITDTFPLVRYGDVTVADDANDFVENLLTSAGMSVVYGDSNTGKTFWAMDLALHVAFGWPWQGSEVEQGAVIYCALEGGAGVRNRIAAFRQEHPEMADAPFYIVQSQINLFDPKADLPKLLATIKKVADAAPMPVRLVVIDTLARALAGGNENSGEDMGRVVVNAGMIQQLTGAHVMFVHHTGKDAARGARGHSSLRAATDTEIEISRMEGSDFANVRVTKQRDLEGGQEYAFTLKRVEVGINRRGKVITSCVIRPVETRPKEASRKPLSAQMQIALDALRDTIAEYGERVQPTSGMPEIMCARLVRWDALCRSRHLSDGAKPDSHRTAMKRAMEILVQRGFASIHGDFVWLLGPVGLTPDKAGQ